MNNIEEYRDRKQTEFYDKYPLCFPKGEPVCGFNVGYGWWSLLKTLCENLTKELEKSPMQFCVEQTKEKFGGLRFYINNGNEAIHALINEAENKSYDICEECGAPGTLRQKGWFKVRCDVCQIKFEKTTKNRF